MARPSLDDSLKKLARAQTHLKELKGNIIEYRQGRPYTVSREINPDNGEATLALKVTQQPDELGVIVGDIIFNLRAALDYIVYALAWLDSGIPKPDTQFPIADTPEKFQTAVNGRLKGVDPSHVAAIEATQPYNAGQHWLTTLRELSNADKHMRLHLVGSQVIDDLALRDDADPEAPPLDRAVDPMALNVHVDFDIALYEAFEDGSAVVETLNQLETEVGALIQEFNPLFQVQT